MSIYLLHGSDRLAVRERRDALLAVGLPAGDDGLALTRLDGQKCSADELLRTVSALPFFGDRRVVLLDDLCTRFESKRGRKTGEADEAEAEESAGKPTAAKGKGKSDPSRPYSEAIAAVAPTTTLILWERGPLTKTNALLKAVAPLGQVEQFDAPGEREMEDWIFDRARRRRVHLKPDVPRLLAEHLGHDLEILDSELEKLGLYVGTDGYVDTAMVRTLTPQTRTADTLGLLKAAADRRLAEALSILHELLDNGVVPIEILGMLASQVRKLLQVQALSARRLSQADIATQLGMHPYAAKLTQESLRHYTSASLRDLHARLLATDQAIKTGQADGEAALELLVLDLAR